MQEGRGNMIHINYHCFISCFWICSIRPLQVLSVDTC